MNQFAKTFSLSACALAATLLISACGGGATGDTVAPTAVITSAPSTVSGNTTYTFAFSEDVGKSFSVEDLLVTGGAASNFTKVDASTYTVDITPIGSATPTLTLPAGKVFDLANNGNVVAFTPAPPALTAPAAAAPTPTALAANVISIYSDAYTQTTGVNLNPNWGQSTAVTEIQVASNNTEKYATLNYQGIDFVGNAINVSGMSKLHIDVWTPDVTSIKVSLIATTGGGENAVTVTPTLAGWNSFDIDLAGYTVPDKTKIDQIKIEGAPAGGTIYFDNLYFWKAAPVGCGTTEPTCAPTTVIPAGATTIYSETAATPGFDAFPNWGQSTQFSEVTLASNKSLKYSNLNYQGLAFTSLDVSTKGKLHLDVWSAAAGNLNVGIITSAAISGGGALETQVPQTLVAGWNSLDIPLTSFTAPNKAKIDQLILVGTGTIFVDNIYFWDASSAGGGGASGGGTFTGGVFSSDYTGSLADGSAKSTLGGNVGFFFDQRLFDTKIYQDGGVSGSAADPGGVHNFWYGFGKAATPVYTDAYFGGFVNAPSNTTADASAFAKVQLKFWGDAETWEKNTFTPQVEVILQGPTNVACTNGSGRPEISRTVAGQKIGAGSLYTILKTDFTLTANCGGAYTIDNVWSQVGSIAVKLSGTNLQYVTTAPSTPPAYPTFLNIGPISFIN